MGFERVGKTKQDQSLAPILIPAAELSAEALSGVINEFILREGTDYGANEVEFSKKYSQVVKQVQSGQVLIVFDPNEGTVTLLNQRDWIKLLNQSEQSGAL